MQASLSSQLSPAARLQLAAAKLRRQAGTRAAPIGLPGVHAGQAEVLTSPARFRILNCGRRWRKSSTVLIALIRAAESKPNSLYWWVWPTGPMGQTGWDMLRRACAGRVEVWESRRRVRFPQGGEIWVKSADHEDGLRGAGLDGLAIDECRDIDARAWHEVLRPAITDKHGWAMFLSTPRGYDWFHMLYQQAENKPDWARWTFTTPDNPDIDPHEIEQARQDMPERLFRQEIMAEFIADAGSVFRGVDASCVVAEPELPQAHPGHSFVFGCDWGKHDDFTALTVLCRECSRVVEWDHFNQIDYIFQRGRLAALAARWNPTTILAESNSIGEPNIEMLQREGLPVIPFETTATSKPLLIESLSLALERGQVRAPCEYAGELRAYEMTRNEHTGRPRYGAPAGLHDDRVMSLALAWYAALYNPTDLIGW